MKLLIDMNLSPRWVAIFKAEEWQALHWADVGDPRASDSEIMSWARANDYVVFTHDLDLGILLATSGASGPSVIQVRTQDVMPEHLSGRLITAVKQYESILAAGALATIDERKSRIRILPI